MEVWEGVGARRGHLCLHNMGSRDGAVLRGLASYHCGLGSIPGPDVTCGLGLLLEDFFPFPPQKPTFSIPIRPRNTRQEEPPHVHD